MRPTCTRLRARLNQRTCGSSATTTCRHAPPISRSSSSRATAGSPTSGITAASESRTRSPARTGGQRHFDRRRDRSEAAEVSRAHSGRGGQGEQGGAQMVRVCSGKSCRKRGQEQVLHAAHVRQPGARNLGRDRSRRSPSRSTSWSAVSRTRTRTGGNATPASPTCLRRPEVAHQPHDADLRSVAIRRIRYLSATSALVGQQPGSTGAGADRAARPDLHRQGNRVYFGYGTLRGVCRSSIATSSSRANPHRGSVCPTPKICSTRRSARTRSVSRRWARIRCSRCWDGRSGVRDSTSRPENFRSGKPAKRDFVAGRQRIDAERMSRGLPDDVHRGHHRRDRSRSASSNFTCRRRAATSARAAGASARIRRTRI